MFVSHAHSFRQQARLAVTLAWVGGYTNIVALLICGSYVSNMSGNTTAFGHTLFSGQRNMAIFKGLLLGSFFFGAAISGFCTELGRRWRWESIFVLPIGIEIAALGLFATLVFLMESTALAHPWSLGMLLAGAMGLQNATITYISNGVVRTTHVTGIITDLGHEGAQFICWLHDRRRNSPPAAVGGIIHSLYHHPPARRLVLLAAILVMFALGAGLGTLAIAHVPRVAAFIPVLFLGWLIYLDMVRPIAEIELSELIRKESGLDLPSAIAIFHLRRDHDRHGKVHRLPNLVAWAEQLSAATRVVILDLDGVIQINANAAMELRNLIGRFNRDSRALVLAGINQQQFTQISQAVGDALLEPENACGDLELAIARGINLAGA